MNETLDSSKNEFVVAFIKKNTEENVECIDDLLLRRLLTNEEKKIHKVICYALSICFNHSSLYDLCLCYADFCKNFNRQAY